MPETNQKRTAVQPSRETDPPRNPFIRLSEHTSRDIQWLWPERIPMGALTIVEGDPGANKSTLTYDLAARVSTGNPMPNCDQTREPSRVLILQGEDTLDIIQTKLRAAGADLSKIIAYDRTRNVESEFAFPDDFDCLQQEIQRTETGLVTIDPWPAFFGSNMNQDQSVRRALRPLAALAEKTGTAIVLVRHLSKSSSANALYRGAGSIGLIAAARSSLLVAVDPGDVNRRIVAQVKSSWGKISQSQIFAPREGNIGVSLEWLGQSSYTADELLAAAKAGSSDLHEAMYFLHSILGEGPVAAGDVLQKARRAGLSQTTLRRAKKTMKVESKRRGFGPGSTFFWVLPEDAEVLRQLKGRDISELMDKLCHGPTAVDLADGGMPTAEERFETGGTDSTEKPDPADWWKDGQDRGDDDDSGEENG